MEKLIRKPSSFMYDESATIDEVMAKYDTYLARLSDHELRREIEERKTAWLSFPSVFNVRSYMRCKEKMLERESSDFVQEMQ